MDDGYDTETVTAEPLLQGFSLLLLKDEFWGLSVFMLPITRIMRWLASLSP